MNSSLIISSFMMFIFMLIIRLLFYVNVPMSNGKKMIRALNIPDIRDRDNGGETLVFLYQCAALLMIFMGFMYHNILQIIISVMPPVRHIDGYVTFGLTLVPLSLPVLLGIIISKMYWSNVPNKDKK